MPANAPEAGTIEVTIRDTEGVHELIIIVSLSAKISDCKKALAEQHNKPEALDDSVRFVKFLPNGMTAAIAGDSKLGSRRVLVIEGVSVAPPEEAPPIKSLEDFDEFDPQAEISSPRSVWACYAEGLKPPELAYANMASFKEPGLAKALQRLRHDFFECYRQDVLAMCRRLRDTLLGEEEDADANRELTGGMGATSSSSMSLGRLDGSGNNVSMGRLDGSGTNNSRMCAAGGIWGGPLEQASYPAVRLFFDTMRENVAMPRGGKLFERPLKLPEQKPSSPRRCYSTAIWKSPDGRPDRYAMPTPKPFEGETEFEVILDNSSGNFITGLKFIRDHGYIRVTFVKDHGLAAAWNKKHPSKAVQPGDVIMQVNNARGQKIIEELKNDKVLKIHIKRKDYVPGSDTRRLTQMGGSAENGAGKVQGMVDQLKDLPYGRNDGEQLQGVVLRTESLAVVQRRRNAARLDAIHKEERWTTQRKIEIAEYAKEKMELERLQQREMSETIERNFVKNRGEWKTGLQEANYQKAVARKEKWNARRQAICDQALAQEHERNSRTVELINREIGKEKRTANLRDLQRISYARRWLDRRNRWAQSYTEVRRAVNNWNKGILDSHTDAAARIEDQKMRTLKWVDVVRELKSLRKDFQDMVTEREKRRQSFRRLTVGQGLREMAKEADKLAEEVQKEMEAAAEEAEEDWDLEGFFQTDKLGGKSSNALSSTQSTQAPGGWGEYKKRDKSSNWASSTLGSWSSARSLPSYKGIPRFDFPRVATDLLSPSTELSVGSSLQSPLSMSHSSSAPGGLFGKTH